MDEVSAEATKKMVKPKANSHAESSMKPKTSPRPKTSPKLKASSKPKVGTSELKPISKSSSSRSGTLTAGVDPKSRMTTAVMVVHALEELGNRKGSSLYAIKKCVSEKYNVDTEKITYLIKRFLKSAVDKGDIVQTKGVGAAGSFRLGSKKKKEKADKPKIDSTKKRLKFADDEESIKKKVKSTTNKAESTNKKTGSTKKKAESTKKSKPEKILDSDTSESKEPKEKKIKTAKKKATDFSNERRTSMKVPTKRRKSIGTLVKAPKMKPKAMKPKMKKEISE